MTLTRLNEILDRIRGARIGIAGDFCLDAYWDVDSGEPEISLETGKPTRAVRSQRYAPGGAGNVACNLAALGAGEVRAFGVIGPDMFGRELASLLGLREIDTSGLLLQESLWQTAVYAKPYRAEAEQERIDFGRWNEMRSASALAGLIRRALPGLDALVVNQQLARGIHSAAMIDALNSCARENPGVPFILDARTMNGSFTGMISKLNAKEAVRLTAATGGDETPLPAETLREATRTIAERTGKPVFVTRGEAGILLYDGIRFSDVPALPLDGPVDTVGAGDTAVSAIAACLAAGGSHAEAAELANLASAVTVKKLKETGSATPVEILRAVDHARHVTGTAPGKTT
jgi:rfaE bifunctional protein kinase chain/domain